MTSKRFCILLLALAAAAAGQSEDIPIENDNQFPPDVDGAVIEGSGGGAINMLSASIDTTPAAPLEEVLPEIETETTTTQAQEDEQCPKSCSCYSQGATFNVNCAGNGLTEFPLPLNPKTTSLNIENNIIPEIPKDIATLTNLKELNADNNAIMDLALGSVSGLAQLTVLRLSNNRLIDYPKELKNSIDLTNLEELDLGGNDMRTELNPEIFSNFPSLHKLTLAKLTPELLQDLCGSLINSLEAVCTESCKTQIYECNETLIKTPRTNGDGDNFIDAVIPNVLDSPVSDDADPALDDKTQLGTEETPKEVTTVASITKETDTVANEGTASEISDNSRFGNVQVQATPNRPNIEVPEAPKSEISVQSTLDDKTQLGIEETPKEVSTVASINKQGDTVANEGTASEISGNSRFGNVAVQATPNRLNIVVPETPKNEISDQSSETDLHVGATTTDGKTGGVDKSVIGIIVAGMVVVVAGIAIKKNWSSIRKRFSPTPTAAERADANVNGTLPEEVPLQDKDKSPV